MSALGDLAQREAARAEARRRLDTRWTDSPHPDLTALPEGEGRAYIFGFGRGAEFALGALASPEVLRGIAGVLAEHGWRDIDTCLCGVPAGDVAWMHRHKAEALVAALAEKAEGA